jgi:hypothetical protein
MLRYPHPIYLAATLACHSYEGAIAQFLHPRKSYVKVYYIM